MYIYLVVGLIIAFQIPAMCICSDGLVSIADSSQYQQNQAMPQHQRHQQQLQQQDDTHHQHNQQQQQQQQQQQPSPQNDRTITFRNQSTDLDSHQNQHEPRQHLSTDDNIRLDLRTFRLEYNKYKILSHLGITADPAELNPQLGDELRTQLTAATLFSNANLESGSSSSGARHKRSLSCDQVNGNKSTCCLEKFYVNFTTIGWDKWILYPAGYNANYCRGQCDLSHARYYHSTLLSKYNNVVSLCCSPRQVVPLRLLYIDEDNKVHQKSIPDMIVESCDCA